LKFSMVIDLYCMDGDPAPTYSAIHTLVSQTPTSQQARVYSQLIQLMAEYTPPDELKLFEGHFGHLTEKSEIKESKETKESKEIKKDSFLMVRGSRV